MNRVQANDKVGSHTVRTLPRDFVHINSLDLSESFYCSTMIYILQIVRPTCTVIWGRKCPFPSQQSTNR